MQSGADPKTMMWSQYDLARNLLHDPLHLMDGSAFYPHRRTLAVVDHQLGNAWIAAPLVAVGAGVITTFNVVFVATFFLSATFMCVLVRRLTGSLLAGVLAGCAFAFSAARVYNLPHVHVLATQWIPLGLLALHAYLERPTWRRWLALLGGALLVATSSWHIMVIGGIAMAIVALWTLASVVPGSARPRCIAGLGSVAALCLVAVFPVASAYLQLSRDWPPVREGTMPVENVVRTSVDVGAGMVGMPQASRAPYSGLLATAGPSLFPGFVTLALAVPVLLRLRRRDAGQQLPGGLRWSRIAATALVGATGGAALMGGPLAGITSALASVAPWVLLSLALAAVSLWRATQHAAGAVGPENSGRTYLAVAVAGVLLAFGPRVMLGGADMGSGLWRLDLLPVPLLMRAPVRFSLLLALGLAVLIGHSAAAWLRGKGTAATVGVVALLLLALNVDLAFSMPELAAAPAPSGVDRWLAEESNSGAVIEFPLAGNYWAIYASQQLYDRPNVDGRGFLRPPAIRRMRARADFSRPQINLLWEYSHPRYVVLRGALYSPSERATVAAAIEALRGALVLRAQDGDDAVYELFDHGAGAQLVRRWPAEMLRESNGVFHVTAALSPDAAAASGRLVVRLNDRVLAEVSGDELRMRERQALAFDPSDVVAGENTLELRIVAEDDAAPPPAWRVQLRALQLR
jgi:hypothetical protein